MNRSFRATAPVAAMDKGDDLALFLEMRNRDKDRNNLLLFSDDDYKLGSKPMPPVRRTAAEELLNSDNDKHDYDWLITPPSTPLFPSFETPPRIRSPPMLRAGTPKARQTMLTSRLANSSDAASRNSMTSRQVTSSSSLSSSGVGNRRLSSSGSLRAPSRPTTPTGRGRATSSATSKPSRPSTPTSRATIPTKPGPPLPRTSAPARSSTLASIRSSVPVSTRSSVALSTRPSTPTSRPCVSASSKPASRPATPTRRPSGPSVLPLSCAPPGRSSPATKSGPTVSKSCTPSRCSSPNVRSRPWNPSDMPGFSLEAPPNLRTSLPDRPSSACRGRPGAAISRSIAPEPIVRPRRQSCSPSRGRAPNGIGGHSGSCVPAVGRSQLKGGDSVSPVVIGSKMVERVVNARRLVPPKQDDQRSSNSSITGKSSSSPDSVGFGRTMSKKSLDMALRHMDIRRSIPNNLRPLMMNIPPSVHSARSGSTRSRSVSVSGSPMATSSNASSEQSFSNNVLYLDGSEAEDDLYSYKGGNYSPAGPVGR